MRPVPHSVFDIVTGEPFKQSAELSGEPIKMKASNEHWPHYLGEPSGGRFPVPQPWAASDGNCAIWKGVWCPVQPQSPNDLVRAQAAVLAQ